MNKKLFSMFFLAGLTLVSSCKDKDEDPEGSNENGNYVAPSEWAQGSSKKYVENPNEIQPVKVQQYQLEATAMALANHHKSVNFDNVIDLARYANDQYINNKKFNDDAVSDFFDIALDLCTSNNPNPKIYDGYWDDDVIDESYLPYYWETPESFDVHKYEDIIKGYYIKLFQSSKFYTHFQENGNSWVEVPGTYNDLQFEFRDKEGLPCVLNVSTSGKEKTVYVEQDHDNWDWYEDEKVWVDKDTVFKIRLYNKDKDKYNYDKYDDMFDIVEVPVKGYYLYKRGDKYDVNDIKISVPEHVKLTLTQNGNTLVSSEVNMNIDGIENERININKTNLVLSTKTKIGPTEIVVNNCDHKNGDKSKYNVFSSINGKKLYEISGEYLLDINFKGDQNYGYLEDLMYDVFEEYETNITKFTGIVANINILNELQIKTAISDAKKVIDLFDDADKHDEEEAYYKAKIEEINKLINMGLYYYGGSKMQASLRLESFEKEYDDWHYNWETGEYSSETVKYWSAEPVIEFDGGQTYAIDEFFNEDDFRRFVNLIEEIGNDYEDKLDF